jgi:hypothetical protein
VGAATIDEGDTAAADEEDDGDPVATAGWDISND